MSSSICYTGKLRVEASFTTRLRRAIALDRALVTTLLCALDCNADYLVSDDHSLTSLNSSYAKPLIGKSEDLAKILGA